MQQMVLYDKYDRSIRFSYIILIISQKSNHEYFVGITSKLQFFIQDNVVCNIIL